MNNSTLCHAFFTNSLSGKTDSVHNILSVNSKPRSIPANTGHGNNPRSYIRPNTSQTTNKRIVVTIATGIPSTNTQVRKSSIWCRRAR